MKGFKNLIEKDLKSALTDLGVSGDLWRKLLSHSRERSQGDLTLPCFPLGKQLSRSPIDMADDLVTILASKHDVSATNGYLNFKADGEWLAQRAIDGKKKAGSKKILIEHTSANPNGPFHVGRARNAILGDTMVRLYRLNGDEVKAEYYVDDMGKQVAILAWALANLSSEEVDEVLTDKDEINPKWEEKADHARVRWYQAAQALREQRPEIDQEIAKMVHDSEDGDDSVLVAFENAYQPVLDGMLETLSRMGIGFDTFTRESVFVIDGSVAKVMARLESLEIHGTADNGAHFLDLGARGLKGKTEFFFRRGDGSSLYATRDIAYHMWKWQQGFDLLNVLGEDHRLQSKQVGMALEELGEKAPEVIFYAFIKLPEGKMSTRKGNVVFMDDLLDEAKEHAAAVVRELRPELDTDSVEEIAEAVGVSAVRFNIIRVSPEKGFTFTWDEALSFEGNSAPFIMYSHTRACSIARKVGRGSNDCTIPSPINQSTKELLRTIELGADVLDRTLKESKPHLYANHLLELASTFNAFYRDNPVVVEGVVDEFNFAICERTRVLLHDGMVGLGIEPLASM
ncbi:MAG: arginine--tRNA ligase [Candidatus Poseidoniales archaeon]